MKEIGSNFNNNIFYTFYKYFTNKEYKKLDNFFLSGRYCLKYILNNLSFKNYLIPNYNCKSVENQFFNKNIFYYEIDNNFNINIDNLKNILLKNNIESILIIDYFGNVDKNIKLIINILKEKNIFIIQDFTHNIFNDYFYGDISYCSSRKMLEIPFGGYFIDKNNILKRQENLISFNYFKINLLRLIGLNLKNINFLKPIWRKILIYTENELENFEYFGFDYFNYFFFKIYYNKNIINKRINNFNYLKNELKYNYLENSSFCYVYKCNNKENLKKILIENKIYCADYWPNTKIINDKLFIPIDQRYSIKDMNRIIKLLKM